MTNKNNHSILLLVLLVVVAVTSVGLLAGYFTIKDAVSEKFGPPSPHLTLTQQIIFPLELFFNRSELTTPMNLAGQESLFEIGQGESVSMICLRLEGEGLIEDAELFRSYLVYTGLDRHLQSGRFPLNSTMSPVQIAAELLDATPEDAVVSILPGWRIEEVAVNIASSGLDIPSEVFIHAAYAPSSDYLSVLPIEDISSLEGFLFPNTYAFPRETDLDGTVVGILSMFTQQIDTTLMDGFSRQGLTLYEAVIVASLIEKEAVLDEEKPLIASVFINRLSEGMRLETDPTVQYALGYQSDVDSWWKSPLSESDLLIDSPYNTYVSFGLPPTPICNPDLGSLRAVAFPAETPYFYFRAACDGSGRHNFAITYEEHLNNACE